ncbi:hypothetical protein [Aquirhabdus parva]|uniref:Uncharacterized protein n=1 Tax=Aquirhabdus parva TaxID=2283318 RepID=A0A345P993_9GAMM|nr:hypothetical protein [Aquirhabdus parva]AXI03852.1 hypothetical protein HYN46_14010 [Aquirhabdus parva]
MGSNTWQPKQDQPLELTRDHLNVLLKDRQPVQQGGGGNAFFRPTNNMARPSRGFDPLGALFPRTMSAFARDPNYAAALNQQANLRNITAIGAGVAASPYIVGLGAVAGTEAVPAIADSVMTGARTAASGYKALPPMTQGALGGAVGGGGFNAVSQKVKGGDFDYKQTLKAGALGSATGVLNAGLATAAGVTPVSWSNLYKNLENRVGLDIFMKTAILKRAAQEYLNSLEQPYNEPDTPYKSSKKP